LWGRLAEGEILWILGVGVDGGSRDDGLDAFVFHFVLV
jgi:hypothetical protein